MSIIIYDCRSLWMSDVLATKACEEHWYWWTIRCISNVEAVNRLQWRFFLRMKRIASAFIFSLSRLLMPAWNFLNGMFRYCVRCTTKCFPLYSAVSVGKTQSTQIQVEAHIEDAKRTSRGTSDRAPESNTWWCLVFIEPRQETETGFRQKNSISFEKQDREQQCRKLTWLCSRDLNASKRSNSVCRTPSVVFAMLTSPWWDLD